MADTVEDWPFRENQYPPGLVDDWLPKEREWAKRDCLVGGLDWSKAYRTCTVTQRSDGSNRVVITWRTR